MRFEGLSGGAGARLADNEERNVGEKLRTQDCAAASPLALCGSCRFSVFSLHDRQPFSTCPPLGVQLPHSERTTLAFREQFVISEPHFSLI